MSDASTLPGYRRDIDGLRALAVVPVVLFHAGCGWCPGGYVGVDVFFVISGFLITGILRRELEGGRYSILSFYERRVRRIFPALFAMLFIVTVATSLLFLPEQLADFGKSLAAATLFLSNVYFRRTAGYFDGPSDLKPLLHTWSLAVEEQFYIVFPLYLLAVFRFVRLRLPLTIAVAALSLAASAWAVTFRPPVAFYLAPARANELLLGALVSMGLFPAPRNRAMQDGLSLLGIGLIVGSVLSYTPTTPFPGIRALVPCTGAALVICAGTAGPSFGGRLLGTEPVVWVGRISYSLYLWHWPLLALAKYWAIWPLSKIEVAAAVGAAVVASFLSWRFVENPFRGRDAVLGRRGLFVASGLLMGGFAAAGVAARLTGGLPARLGSHGQELARLELMNESCPGQGQADPYSGAKRCSIGDDSGERTFLVWGDSHAMAFFPPLDAAAKRRGLGGLFFARLGCMPALGVEKVESGMTSDENDGCPLDNDLAFRSAVGSPSIKEVVLVARWQYYATGVGYGVDSYHRIRLFSEGRGHLLSESEIEERLLSTIRALMAAGKTVHLLEPVPEFTVRTPDSYGRLLMYGRDLTQLDEAEAASEPRNALVRNVVRALGSDERFRFVAMHDLFCARGVCRPYGPSGPLYMDNNHIGKLANGIVAPRVDRVFSDLSPGGPTASVISPKVDAL